MRHGRRRAYGSCQTCGRIERAHRSLQNRRRFRTAPTRLLVVSLQKNERPEPPESVISDPQILRRRQKWTMCSGRVNSEIALDDDAIETVIYKSEQAAKQLVKSFHRSSPLIRASATRSCARRLVETTSFDNRYPDSDRNVRSTPSFITKGRALGYT